MRIDRDHKGYIESIDVYSFLEENGLTVSEKECSLWIKLHDFNNNGQIDFTEFL